jgi:hypothetical protein
MTTNMSPGRGFLLEEPESGITSLYAGTLLHYDRFLNDHFELTDEEKARPGFIGRTLVLESIWRSCDGRHTVDWTRHTYTNDAGFFTVAEVIAHIVEFERVDRPKSLLKGGGVDCHHVWFEGLRPNSNKDAFYIQWGS